MRRAVLALAVACSSTPPASKPMPLSDDEQLIARVRQAAGGPVETLEDVVGKPAALHTKRFPIEGLRRVELVVDPAFPREPFSLDGARDVVYWARPIETRDPHVVGIIVRTDGTSRVFFASMLPP